MSAPPPLQHHHHFLKVDSSLSSNSALLVAAITLLLLVLLFVLLLHLYAKCFIVPHASYPLPPHRLHAFRTPPSHRDSSAGDPSSPIKGGGGLDPSAIASVPLFAYGGGALGPLECVICLGAFRDGDLGRTLLTCAHRTFHVDCIDAWLLSHSTCPVCRAPVTASPAPAGIGSPAVLGTEEEEEEEEEAVIEITGSNDDVNDERNHDAVFSLQQSVSMGRSLRMMMISRNHRLDRKIYPSSSSSSVVNQDQLDDS